MAQAYTKGTRIWITDKDQGWISAEITSTQPSSTPDTVKLGFTDERGKVSHAYDCSSRPFIELGLRNTSWIPPRKSCHRYETLRY